MFSYYGSKSKLVHRYPAPECPCIIEAFAGSARYALMYHDRYVWINDSNPTIARMWDYLRNASVTDILALPELKKGEDLRDVRWLSAVERDLLGFAVGRGHAGPAVVAELGSGGRNPGTPPRGHAAG